MALAPWLYAGLSLLLTPGLRDIIYSEIPHIDLWPLPVSQGALPLSIALFDLYPSAADLL